LPLRILTFADTRFPIERANGLQTMATCHALARRGHDVRLIVRPDTAVPVRDPFAFYSFPREPKLRIDTVPAPRQLPARRARFLVAAIGIVASARADLIYTRDLGLAAFLLQLGVPRRPPVVYESHGVSVVVAAEMPALLGKPDAAPSPRKLDRLDRRERRVWRRAQAYVAITRALAGELEQRYGARERVFVVPDGAENRPRVSVSEFDSGSRFPVSKGSDPPFGERGQTPSVHIAGYAGHLYPWKGVDVFVRALALAPAIHGLIVGGHAGEQDLARVRSLVAELGLADRVTITGHVPPAEVASHLAGATMLVLPNTPSAISERYTSPLKLFEYLGLGKPIVASRLPSILEVLTDGQTALLVPAGDEHALAAALSRLAADAALSHALGAAALALAPTYTWDRRAELLEAAFVAATSA
jgi:glycosyltransferase involved in cell wall biosynthesis